MTVEESSRAALQGGAPVWRPCARLTLLLTVLALLGIGAFVYGLESQPIRAWTALLVNFLFWGGLAYAGVVLSACFQLTAAGWARPVKRLAEGTAAFLPVAAFLLVVLLVGANKWVPWMMTMTMTVTTAVEPDPARGAWLNRSFFTGRELLAFLVLMMLSLAYVAASVRPDLGRLHPAVGQRQQGRLAPAVVIAYALVLSLWGFDFVMSLDPQWFSTLIGGYFFIGALYVGVAFLAIVTAWAQMRPEVARYVSVQHLHDVGRLLFGFVMLWAYLFWAQYLVIWYGDLPEETAFVAHRTVDAPWSVLSWVVFGLAFLVPFVVLLSREVKRQGRGLTLMAGVALIGMWLERFVLVGPSLWHEVSLPLGLVEVSVTAGVGALFLLCYRAFLARVPLVPVTDPLLASSAR